MKTIPWFAIQEDKSKQARTPAGPSLPFKPGVDAVPVPPSVPQEGYRFLRASEAQPT